MKKLFTTAFCIILLACSMLPFSAFSAGIPALTDISFNGARLDSEFSSNVLDYTITLDNPSQTPTLASYNVDTSANIFVTYSTDESDHQNGIVVKLEYDNGAVYYNFKYSNAESYNISSNNFLKEVDCELGEVYPKLNENDTNYKLYVPADLTEIELSVATDELSAKAEVPGAITLNETQEPVIPVTVTASNGETRAYHFKVKRLRKNSQEVREILSQPNHKSIVNGEFFYQRPEFLVAAICIGGGVLVLLCAVFVAKRIIVKVGDDEEKTFFEI